MSGVERRGCAWAGEGGGLKVGAGGACAEVLREQGGLAARLCALPVN